MPVIGVVAASADVLVTSSDGKIRAWPRSQWGSVSLRVTLDSAATTATVWRQNATTGERSIVRTGDAMAVLGGAGIAFDHEAPPGSTLTYTVIPANGASAGVESAGATVTTATIPAHSVWVKDPHAPVNSRLVTGRSVMRPSSRTRRQGVFEVVGRANPVVVSDSLGARTGEVGLLGLARADRTPIRRLVESSVLLIQLDASLDEPSRFVAISTDSEEPFGPRALGITDWILSVVEVDRPATPGAPLMIPGQSYAEFTGRFASYSAASSAFAGKTYLDVIEGV